MPCHQNGGTYGIGVVVVAHFDAPVGDRPAAEQQLVVSTSPPVSGAWYWVDDQTAHWRPPQYHAPGTAVTIAAGQDPPVTFTNGASHAPIADDATKQVSFNSYAACLLVADRAPKVVGITPNGLLAATARAAAVTAPVTSLLHLHDAPVRWLLDLC